MPPVRGALVGYVWRVGARTRLCVRACVCLRARAFVRERFAGTGGMMQCIEVHYDRKSETRVPSHVYIHAQVCEAPM